MSHFLMKVLPQSHVYFMYCYDGGEKQRRPQEDCWAHPDIIHYVTNCCDRCRQHFRVLCIYLLIALTVTATTSSLFNRRLKREENNNDKQRGVGHECTIILCRASGDCTTTERKNHTKLFAMTRTCCMLQKHQARK
ncbi:unnamed protein product [Ectocarpus sp. 8 AP-2014]